MSMLYISMSVDLSSLETVFVFSPFVSHLGVSPRADVLYTEGFYRPWLCW